MPTFSDLPLDKKYPTLAEKINTARQEGYDDAEIQQHIYGKIKTALGEGYTIREVSEHLKMPLPERQQSSFLETALEYEGEKIGERARKLGGGVEAAATAATGLLSWIPAGLYSAYERSPIRGIKPEAVIEEAEEREPKIKEKVEKIQDALTYKPKFFKEEAEEQLAPIQRFFQLFQEGGEKAGEATLEKTRSPLLAAGAKTAVEGAPFWLPALIRSGWRVRPRGGKPITEVPSKVKPPPPEMPKAEIKTAYHGTSDLHAANIKKTGFKFPEEHGMPATYTIEPEGISLTTKPNVAQQLAANTAEYMGKGAKPKIMKIDTRNLKIYDDTAGKWGGHEDFDAFLADLKKKGYDAVQTGNTVEGEILVFNPEKIRVGKGVAETKPPVSVKQKPKIAPQGEELKLTSYEREIINSVKKEVEEGSPGFRFRGGSQPSTYPEFMRNAFTRKDTINALNKAINNKVLTNKQFDIANKALEYGKRIDEELSLAYGESGQITLPSGEIREAIYQKFLNRFASIENTVKKAQRLGVKIEPGMDAGKRARGYLGISGKVRSVLDDKTFRITREGKIEITGEGLQPILKDYDRLSVEKNAKIRERDLNDYQIAQRTINDLQRPARGGKRDIATPEQVERAKRTIAALQAKYGDLKLFQDISQRLYGYRARVLKTLVDSGVMSEELYNNILTQNPHYVSFERIIAEEGFTGGGPRSKGVFTGARTPVKRIKGSELEIANPLESDIKNTFRIMDIAERNMVARGIAELKDIPELGIREVRVKNVPVAQVEGEAIYRPSQFKPKGNVVEYFVDGERRYIEVPRNLYESMSGLNEVSVGLLTKILSKPAHWLRTGATITPEFMLRNPIRDQMTALIQTRYGFKPFVDSTGAIADILGKTDAYYDWMRSGGANSTFTELTRQNLSKMVKELKGNKPLLKKLNVISRAQDISQLMEQATRVGVYKAGVKKGVTPIEAGFMSRESTIDFFRRGSQMKDVNQSIAFFNAGLQGVDRAVRTFKEHPVSATTKAITTISVPSLLLYLKNRNDPDYKELPRWQKDLFWMVAKIPGTSTFIRIPKPFLFGQVFGSVPERFLEYLDSKDPAAFNDLEKSLLDSVLPAQGDPAGALLPTAMKPWLENATNWSFFREAPVVPRSKEDLLPFMQHGKYTSETLKKIGEDLGYSPAKIENLIRGYTGGTGQYALQLLDLTVKKSQEKRPRELADYPLTRGFVTRPVESHPESLNVFYERSGELISAYHSLRAAIKEGRQDRAQLILKRYPKIQQFGPSLIQIRNKITEISRAIDQVVQDKNLNTEQKRKRIKELEVLRMKAAQSANKMMR